MPTYIDDEMQHSRAANPFINIQLHIILVTEIWQKDQFVLQNGLFQICLAGSYFGE